MDKIMTKDEFLDFQDSVPELSNDKISLYELSELLFKKSKNDKTDKLILILLSNISALSYDVSNPQFFCPRYPLSYKRTVLPEDFSEDELKFIIEILPVINHKMLKAIIIDLLWSRKKIKINKLDYVIDTYLALSCYSDALYENEIYIARGLWLATIITKKKNKINEFISNAIKEFSNNVDFLNFANLLFNCSIDKKMVEIIISKLCSYSVSLGNNNDYGLGIKYLETVNLWLTKYKYSADHRIENQVKIARLHIKWAEHNCFSNLIPNHYRDALLIIKKVDDIDKNLRQKYFSDIEYDKLIKKLNNSRIKAIESMGRITISVDIKDTQEMIIKHFSSKSKDSVLHELAYLNSDLSFKTLENEAVKELKDSPLLASLNKTKLKDGRIQNQIHGIKIDLNRELSQENIHVYSKMVEIFLTGVVLHVQAGILPALRTISNEHCITSIDIEQLVANSPIIPRDRVSLFVKGILAGFNFDFTTSLALLVPQIENLVRYHLVKYDANTIHIDKTTQKEDEVSINSLVKLKEFNEIFGEDLAFELKALFCDGAGPNLRNNVAHGLLDEAEMNSVYSVYCWWFCFRLMYCHNLDNQTTTEKHKGAAQ